MASTTASPSSEATDENDDVVVCPPQITGLTASPGVNSVALTWSALAVAPAAATTADPIVSGLRVQVVRDDDRAAVQEIEIDADAQATQVSGLANGVQYAATVTAFGPNGDGPVSESVSFTPTTGADGEIGGLLIRSISGNTDEVPGSQRVNAVQLTDGGAVIDGVDKVTLSEAVDLRQATEIAQTIASEDSVDWAEPDLVLAPAALPAADTSATSPEAWNITGEFGVGKVTDENAGAGMTVAVIDTGVTDHPALRDRLVPGYDFVSDASALAAVRSAGEDPVSFDGDYVNGSNAVGRDADPSDPGDWRGVTPVRDSTWHGTQVGSAIAEAVPGARIQPIRALSWRGGLLSDVAAGIDWASGGTVEGVPANATPSRIINLSFAVQAACPRTLQTAIDAAVGRGSVVVAAAGNANEDAGSYAPGNCANVVTVGATGRDGKRAAYSNFGSVVDFSAPGGALNADGGVIASSNTGQTAPVSPTTRAAEGTSIAAAHTSAALAVIAGKSASGGPSDWVSQLTGRQLRTFAGESCDADTTKSCGAGIVQIAAPPGPFTCQPVLYQTAARTDTNKRGMFSYDVASNVFTDFNKYVTTSSGISPNSIGYNTADNYVYGLTDMANGLGKLVRIDDSGLFTPVNTWQFGDGDSSTPAIPTSNLGDFWGENRLVVGAEGATAWAIIDVTNTSDDATQSSAPFPISGEVFRARDITILGDTGYGLEADILYILNMNTRVVTKKTVTFSQTRAGDGGFGSAYTDVLGNLYFFENSTSQMWVIRAANVSSASPTAEMIGSGPAYVAGAGTTKLGIPNDGASCPNARSPYSATISSEAQTSISSTGASLSASVNPNGVSTTVAFCYGTTSGTSGGALTGCTTATATGSPLSASTSPSSVSVDLAGLTSNTRYYWQVVATSSWATTYGVVKNFTTTSAPTTITQSATSVSTTTATLNGTVNPGGLATTVEFCYGTASDLTGCSTVAAGQSPVAAGNLTSNVSVGLTNLASGTTYFAKVSATNSDGSRSGSIVSFTTSALPLVSLDPVASITSSEAQLVGTVNPKGLNTSVSFCYGTASDLGVCTSVAAQQSPLLAVDRALTVTADIQGLNPATTYFVKMIAENTNGSSTTSIGSFTSSAAPLSVTTTTGALPDGIVGSAYSKTLSAGGGAAPYSWRISSGSLPAGLSLNTVTGQISGVPTVDGMTSFAIEVTDASSASAVRTFTITTSAAPTATTRAATSIAGTTATLNATVDPGNSVTAVEFCYGTSPTLTGCTAATATGSPLAASTSPSSVSIDLAGLSLGQTYFARVHATNGVGSSTGSIISFTTSNKPTTTTGAATFLRTQGTEATLTGTVSANGAPTTVTFCFGTTPTLMPCTSATTVYTDSLPLAATATSASVSKDITGLTANTVYYFAIRASNSLGSSAGTTVSFTTPTTNAAGPTISTVSPSTGDIAGGTQITITGTNFSTSGTGGGATVTVGGAAATVTSRSATQIVATTPARVNPGAVDVIVTNVDGQAVRRSPGFTYTSTERFTVTYDGNESTSGTVPTDATAYAYDDTATVLGAGTMARAGYEFDGWNTTRGGTGTPYDPADTRTITDDVTLFAQWTPIAIGALDPTSITFGSRTTTAGPSTARVIALDNTGAATLTINTGGITITGTNASDFTITGGTCTAGGTVTSSASCTITTTFDPTALGTRTATLSVATSTGTLTTTLTGTGVGTFTVTYGGNESTSGTVPTDATAYAYDDTATVLGAGTMARAGYEFDGWNTTRGGTGTPYDPADTRTITDDVTLFAQWTAIAIGALDPTSITFGSRTTTAGPSTARVIALDNTGAATLTINTGGITITGTNASDFTITGGTCTAGGTVTSSASCTITTTFDPTALGNRTATLSVATSTGTLTTTLTGTGVEASSDTSGSTWSAEPVIGAAFPGQWSGAPSTGPVTPHQTDESAAPVKGRSMINRAAFFEPRSSTLTSKGRTKLSALIGRIPSGQHDVTVHITAVSISAESIRANLLLAARRGQALRDFLVTRGVHGTYEVSVSTRGYLRTTDKMPPEYSSTGKPLSTVRISF